MYTETGSTGKFEGKEGVAMTHTELIQALARRMREDEAEAVVAYVSRLDNDDIAYYSRVGIDGLIRCIRGEYTDFAAGTPFHIAHPTVRI